MLDAVRFSAGADATRTKPYVSGGAQYTYEGTGVLAAAIVRSKSPYTQTES